jgi:hypothetical protein
MESEFNNDTARHALSTHILSVSVVMIGVSTTLIGLVKVEGTHGSNPCRPICGSHRLALFFSALASYLSIRWAD